MAEFWKVLAGLPLRGSVLPRGQQAPLLPPAPHGRPTLLLDLDHTLVRSAPLPESQALPVSLRTFPA